MALLSLIAICAFLTSRPAHAQPYAHSWTEITVGGDTIYHVWPPPDSLWLHDQLLIKFRRGALDYSQLCYKIDSIDAGSGLTPDSFMYWPTCKDSVMAQQFGLSVVLDSTVRAILQAHGVSFLHRLTAANPCTDTLSITREGDTITMDHFDWMEAQFGNDTSILTTLTDLYAPDSSGMELAEPIFLGEYAHSPRTPKDTWANSPPGSPWPHYQKSLDMIGMPVAWGFDVGNSAMRVAVIDNGLDYFRCDLGGALFVKVMGGYDYVGYNDQLGKHHNPSTPGIFHGFCPQDSDQGYGGSNHGTPIAAIIGAYTNNFSCGGLALPHANAMAGIAGGWQAGGGDTSLGTGVSLLGYVITDSLACGSHQTPQSAYAASAIMDAAANSSFHYYGSGASIINLSWFFSPSTVLLGVRTAIAEAYRNKVSVDACSGNNYNSANEWPADFEPPNEITSVGAVTSDTNRAIYSDWGKYTDLVAPGGYRDVGDNLVYSLMSVPFDGPTAPAGFDDPGFYVSGTSFSTPHVAGVTALLRDYLSTGGYVHDATQSFHLDDIEGILKASALDLVTVDSPYDADPTDSTYKTGFDELVGWGLLKADNLFNMLDPAGLGYQIHHIEAVDNYGTVFSYGAWSSSQQVTFYNPQGYLGLSGTLPYTVQVREVSDTMSYAYLGLNTSIPVYAWGCPSPKTGWSNIIAAFGGSNFQENWCEVKMDSHTPKRDFGNGLVPGIRHDYSDSLIAHTYQYRVWKNGAWDTLPNGNSHSTIAMDVTVFGVPCPGCKISEGGQAEPEPYPILKVWPPVAHSEFLVSGYGQLLPSRFVLVDALGRVLIDQAVPPSTDHFVVPATGFPSGFYIARLTAGNEIEQARIVISH